MPVNIRLAKKGASRKGRIAMNLLLSCAEGLDQQSDIVIEELEVVVHAFLPAHRGPVYDHLRAGFPANRLRRLEVEIRLDQHYLAVLPPHELDYFQSVRWGRRNPRPRLNVADYIESEVCGKVGE